MTIRPRRYDRSLLPIATTLAVMSMLAGCASAVKGSSDPTMLSYDDVNRGAVPVPASERGLQTVTAEPYFKVSDASLQLEGPAFDRAGNLLFVEVFGGRIMKLTPDKQLSTVVPENKLGPAGLALHKDGRIFAAALGNYKDTGGSVIGFDADGSNMQTIVPQSAGFHPDDIVFDKDGGFYFTDASGTSTEPTGGVYYVAPDRSTVRRVIPNLSLANGVALRADGKVLWVDEYGTGRLHRVGLADAVTQAAWGSTLPYSMVGSAPDSLRTDSDGNVYVAMYQQGRVLVFNDNGIPIGQILLPGREQGHNLISTSLAFVPGSNEILLVSNDGPGGQGSWIWRARGFAKGTNLFSHQ